MTGPFILDDLVFISFFEELSIVWNLNSFEKAEKVSGPRFAKVDTNHSRQEIQSYRIDQW